MFGRKAKKIRMLELQAWFMQRMLSQALEALDQDTAAFEHLGKSDPQFAKVAEANATVTRLIRTGCTGAGITF